jgi:hypothetical protein
MKILGNQQIIAPTLFLENDTFSGPIGKYAKRVYIRRMIIFGLIRAFFKTNFTLPCYILLFVVHGQHRAIGLSLTKQ